MIRPDVDVPLRRAIPAAAAPTRAGWLRRAPGTGDRPTTTALGDRAEGVVIPEPW